MAADGSPTALRDLVLLTWNLAGGLRAGEPGTVAVDDLTIRPGEKMHRHQHRDPFERHGQVGLHHDTQSF